MHRDITISNCSRCEDLIATSSLATHVLKRSIVRVTYRYQSLDVEKTLNVVAHHFELVRKRENMDEVRFT